MTTNVKATAKFYELQNHELDLVYGAGLLNTASAAAGGPLFDKGTIIQYTWWNEGSTVSKPIEALAYGSYAQTRYEIFH